MNTLQTIKKGYDPPVSEVLPVEAETPCCLSGDIRNLHVTYGEWDEEDEEED